MDGLAVLAGLERMSEDDVITLALSPKWTVVIRCEHAFVPGEDNGWWHIEFRKEGEWADSESFGSADEVRACVAAERNWKPKPW